MIINVLDSSDLSNNEQSFSTKMKILITFEPSDCKIEMESYNWDVDIKQEPYLADDGKWKLSPKQISLTAVECPSRG